MPLGFAVSAVAPAQNKVTIYYQYGDTGITETIWTTLAPLVIKSFLMPAYTLARMALAVDFFTFLYARISNAGSPRYVNFVTQSDPGIIRTGAIATQTSALKGTALGAADTDALLYRLKLSGGPSARMFLHGYDGTQDDQGTFSPNPTFTTAIANFLGMLKAPGNQIVFQFASPVLLTSRIPISAIVGIPPRGATLTYAGPFPLVQGQVITIGGVSSYMQGINGRKICVSASRSGDTIVDVGGANPVGTYSGEGGYLYKITPQYAGVDYAEVERITSHRVGRPFGVYPGRKKNRLPLRR